MQKQKHLILGETKLHTAEHIGGEKLWYAISRRVYFINYIINFIVSKLSFWEVNCMIEKNKVIYCKPNEIAEIIETATDYKSLCDLLDCEAVETMELVTDKVVVLHNGEGKLCGANPSRAVFQEDKLTDFKTKRKHQFIDYIAGSFIICGLNEDGELVSLSEKQLSQYLELYLYPEEISFLDEGILILRYKEKTFDLITVPWAETQLFV